VRNKGNGVRFDLARPRDDVLSFGVLAESGPLAFDVYAGTPEQVLFDYAADVGRPQVLPEWSYGVWKGKDKYLSQADLMADVARTREAGIPLDVVIIDSPWETTYNT
jgi:alpha-glucosidase (family GH31 glycosyl hydrolase)